MNCTKHGVPLMEVWGNYKCPICIVNQIKLKEEE